MTVKDIFVHVDGTKGNDARVDAAIDLANQHGALLTGVYVVARPVIPAYAEVQISEEVLKAQASALQESAEQAHESFLSATAVKSLDAEWLNTHESDTEKRSGHTPFADLKKSIAYDTAWYEYISKAKGLEYKTKPTKIFPEGVEPLEVMWHVTTAYTSVVREGFKTKG